MNKLTSNKKSCRILSDLLTLHGVEEVVISPGSRNTPLILAIDANTAIRKRVVIDERIAGFVALGLALSSGRTVGLVCTSGSALLNYSPAIAEAYYQGVPLVVISADRPMQWIDQDDSQTIRQFEALGNFVKKSYDLPEFDDNVEMTWYANRVINDALLTCNEGRKGPVHINVQLNQPLSERIAIVEKNERVVRSLRLNREIDVEEMKILADMFNKKKVLIVGGFNRQDDELAAVINRLSECKNIVVLTETISNVVGEKIISTIDKVIAPLSEEELSELRADIVITFGGALVSRYVKQFLRTHHPERHFSIGYNHTTVDCFKALTDKVELSAREFFGQLEQYLRTKTPEMDYYHNWQPFVIRSAETHDKFISECPWSDLKAFSIIRNAVSGGQRHHLVLSNGTPIRYHQLFDNFGKGYCYCNRGVSGIDGCTSTAIGIANGLDDAGTLLISGDMSFSYDIGALSLDFIPDNFKIIVINNSGGGIFRFISSTASLPQLDKYFAVKPQLPLQKLAEAYNFKYYKANNENELISCMSDFLCTTTKSILEVVTPPEVSGELLRQYMNRK